MHAQNIALYKPVTVSSRAESSTYLPSAVNDGDNWSHFLTKELPWSFVAVDPEALYEFKSISLKVQIFTR